MTTIEKAISLAEDNAQRTTEALALAQHYQSLYEAARRVIQLCVTMGTLASPEQKAAFEHLQELQMRKIK